MARYCVTFVKEWSFEVSADKERTAEHLAFHQFKKEMKILGVNIDYSYIRINDINDEWGKRDF